jgi:hypothetical protein
MKKSAALDGQSIDSFDLQHSGMQNIKAKFRRRYFEMPSCCKEDYLFVTSIHCLHDKHFQVLRDYTRNSQTSKLLFKRQLHTPVLSIRRLCLQVHHSQYSINHLRTKGNLFHFKDQFVPRSKHTFVHKTLSVNAA